MPDPGVPIPSPANARSPASHTPLGTSPAIPNIPLRSSISNSASASNTAGPRSLSRSLKSPPPFSGSYTPHRSLGPTPKPSNDNLIERRASPAAGAGGPASSNLTAQIAPERSRSGSNTAYSGRNDDEYPGSGGDTPGESAVSNVIDVGATNEEKARVLRRHLVSKEERRAGDTTPTGGESGFALGEGSGNGGGSGYASVGGRDGSPGDASGSKSRTGSEHEENFPIPYDALGGDVT